MPTDARTSATAAKTPIRTTESRRGAIESEATNLTEVLEEMLRAKSSERQGRVIDYDESGSMEEKKREGYF